MTLFEKEDNTYIIPKVKLLKPTEPIHWVGIGCVVFAIVSVIVYIAT